MLKVNKEPVIPPLRTSSQKSYVSQEPRSGVKLLFNLGVWLSGEGHSDGSQAVSVRVISQCPYLTLYQFSPRLWFRFSKSRGFTTCEFYVGGIQDDFIILYINLVV